MQARDDRPLKAVLPTPLYYPLVFAGLSVLCAALFFCVAHGGLPEAPELGRGKFSRLRCSLVAVKRKAR